MPYIEYNHVSEADFRLIYGHDEPWDRERDCAFCGESFEPRDEDERCCCAACDQWDTWTLQFEADTKLERADRILYHLAGDIEINTPDYVTLRELLLAGTGVD